MASGPHATVETTQTEIDRLKLQSKMLWGALLMAHILFAGVALSGITASDVAPEVPFLIPVLAVFAMGSAAGSLFVWRSARRPLAGFHADPTAEQLRAVIPRYVLSWALTESIAALALVVALLGHAQATWAAFAVPALLLMLVQRP